MKKYWRHWLASFRRRRSTNLSDLIAQKAIRINRAAQESGQLASAEHVAQLERLKRVLELSNDLRSNAAAQRWPIALLLVLTLALVSALLFLHVSSTEIELDVLASQVTFHSPVQQPLSNMVNVKSLGVSGVAELELPHDLAENQVNLGEAQEAPVNLRLALSDDAGCRGTITLDGIIVPDRARISIRQLPEKGRIVLSFAAPGMRLRAAADGCIEVDAPTVWGRQLRFATPRAFVMTLGEDDADVDITFDSAADNWLVTLIQAQDIGWSRIEQRLEGQSAIVRRISTISSGKLYFSALNDENKVLRTAELLRFSQSKGEVRAIEPGDKQLRIQYQGEVTGMVSGSENHPRNLMPSYLDWLKANHSLSLLWGAAVYLFGMLMALLKWWKQGREK